MTMLNATAANRLKEDFKLINFVETGCELGNGLFHARQLGFPEQRIYSCDLRKEVVYICHDIFPNMHLSVTDSVTFLERVLPTLVGPTLFWLDAHFPEHYGMLGEADAKRMPMFKEIETIKRLKKDYNKDVIICDDLCTLACPENPRYKSGELEDKYYIKTDWPAFMNSFSPTHSVECHPAFEGITIFYPKSRD